MIHFIVYQGQKGERNYNPKVFAFKAPLRFFFEFDNVNLPNRPPL